MTDLKPLGANALHTSMVSLEPLEDHHVEPLRAACAEDQEIWEIYPHSMLGEHFDPVLQAVRSATNRFCFAVIDRPANRVVGMSCLTAETRERSASGSQTSWTAFVCRDLRALA